MSRQVDVAIVGAGAAGIAAARALAGQPLSLLLIEAHDRIGGRALTRIEGGMAIDIGCGWLHSADRNPLVGLGERNDFTIDRTPPPWGEQAGNQGMSAAEQKAFHAAYDGWEERVLAAAPKVIPDKPKPRTFLDWVAEVGENTEANFGEVLDLLAFFGEFVMATGLFQWNTVETYPVTPIANMMAAVTEFPIVFD